MNSIFEDLESDCGELYNFVILDIETTGLSYKYDDIIEFAAGFYSPTNFKIDYHTYVNTDIKLGSKTISLTGITQSKINKAPSSETVFNEIKCRYKGCVLVGHNMFGFDSKFLLRNDSDVFKNFLFLDTYTLAKDLLPGLSSFGDDSNYKLNTLCKLFGVELLNHHTAAEDTTATNYVFAKLLKLADPNTIEKYIRKGEKIKINV